MAMFSIKSRSAWSFDTSGTGGIGLGFFVASGGEIILTDPQKKRVSFRYAGVGAGLTIGLKKIPKLGRFLNPRSLSGMGGAVAPESFPNHGIVYVLDGVAASELK